MQKRELAKMIDHTLLGPTATRSGVIKLCREAQKHAFASVCVSPCHAASARDLLRESDVKVCVVIGFPHGTSTGEVKAFEAQKAIAVGAAELDMVINIAALKEGDYTTILEEIRAVCIAAEKSPQAILIKVILEASLLNDEEKRAGAILAKAGGADFVKTSTGFAPGGATVEDIALLRLAVGETMGVKASGGIHDYKTAIALIEAGATRLGASRSLAILAGVPE